MLFLPIIDFPPSLFHPIYDAFLACSAPRAPDIVNGTQMYANVVHIVLLRSHVRLRMGAHGAWATCEGQGKGEEEDGQIVTPGGAPGKSEAAEKTKGKSKVSRSLLVA